MISLKCIFIVFFAIKSGGSRKSCSFNFKTNYPENPPLLFNNIDRDLVIPIKTGRFKGIQINYGDEILLSCSGQYNHFKDTEINDKVSMVLACSGDNTLTDGISSYDFRSLGCQTRPRSMLLQTYESCANGKAEIFEIGFNITADHEGFWYPLLRVCFDVGESKTYFSKHELSGKGISATQALKGRPFFEVGMKDGLYPDFSPNGAYNYKSQSNTLAQILGSPSLAQQILSKKNSINRGHLAPSGDFFYPVTKSATFYYINAVPQWSSLNAGAWNNLETYIRRLASIRQKNYTIYTGTHEVLTLLNDESKPTPIYLHLSENGRANKLPVPRFIWKIVQEMDDNLNVLQGIAFVSYNNVAESSSKISWPCTNICSDYHWNIFRKKSGFIICCDIKDLKRAVSEISEIDDTNVIMHGLGPEY